MPLLIPGAESPESLVRFDCSSPQEGNNPTAFAAVFNFTHKGPTAWGPDVSMKVANSTPSHNAGVGLTVHGVSNSIAINMRVRTALRNTYNNNVLIASDEVNILGIRVVFTTQTIEYFVNGTLVDPITEMDDGDSWSTTASGILQPFIQSQVDPAKGMQWHEVAFWNNVGDLAEENIDSYVPTASQMEAITAGASLNGFPAPKSHIAPAGTNGAYAASFPDLGLSGAAWTQTSGPTTGDYAPTFVGPPADVDVDVDATARTLSVEGTTSASGGTTYIIVDTAANMPTPPDAADIAGGFLGDGATAAAFSDSAAMATTALEFSFEGVPASTALAYALVHDKDGAGDYSDVTYGTLITKKPVVGPGDFIWRDVNSQPLTNETGMTFTVLGTGYSGIGVSTNAEAKGSVDLTGYVNGGAEVDIGDTVSVTVRRSNGEELIARNVTVSEG